MKDIKLYQDSLRDHYQNPRHKGILEQSDFTSDRFNPSCGDKIIFQGVIKNNTLINVAFDGKGCMLSLAAASLLAEFAIGKTIQEILTFDKKTLFGLVNIELGPTRAQCILLPLQALQSGIQNYLDSHA